MIAKELLKSRQALPLELKETLSSIKIKEYYHAMGGKVYVSFSGGKDSTVLLHLVRSIFPDVKAVFSDTGLEFPEIREFVKSTTNVIWVKPKLSFREVTQIWGFPVISKSQSRYIHDVQNPTKRNKNTIKLRMTGISKNGEKNKNGNYTISKKWKFLINAPFKISDKCCDILKKEPLDSYAKKTNQSPFIGTLACESMMRTNGYLKTGCNSFNNKTPKSTPIAFWTEKDIWAYIKKYNLDYSEIYNMGYKRTGCVFCMFGVHLEKSDNRFQKLQRTHPNLHNYCINKLDLKKVLEYINVPYESDRLLF